MSFITKRDRMFTEADLSDLPPRNEGKLKAYASLVDARAWSHYNSDKSEHLFELIKRNTGKCKQQLIPVDVIVNTLMGAKNAEIERLKGRINQMDRLLSAYEKMELTAEQKAYIKKARAAIFESSSDLSLIKGNGDVQQSAIFEDEEIHSKDFDANEEPVTVGLPVFEDEEINTKDSDADDKVTVITDECTCEIPSSRSDTCFSTCLSAFSGVSKGVEVCPCERPCDKTKEAKICSSGAAKQKPSKIPIPDPDTRSRLSNIDTSQNIKDEPATDTQQDSPPRAASYIPVPQEKPGSSMDRRPRNSSLGAPGPEISTRRVSCTDTVCDLRSPPGSSSIKITDTRTEAKPCRCTPKEIVSVRRSSDSVLESNNEAYNRYRSAQEPAYESAIGSRSIYDEDIDKKINGTQPKPLPVQKYSTLSAEGSSVSKGPVTASICPRTLSARSSCISKCLETSSAHSVKTPERNDAYDNNMDTLKQQILKKDAELAAMQNTISVLESDVCEPYCVYAKIYTMLEKILGILKQNKKYMKFLDAVTQSKDISDLDLRAKIIFKLNVLEKFSSALTMGCKKNSQGTPSPSKGCQDTECYHAEVLSYLNPSFGLPNIDYSDFEDNSNRLKDDDRARLVAQIIEADDFNSIIQSINDDVLNKTHHNNEMDNMSIKIKELQDCYDELLSAYSDLKDERNALVSKIIECEEALQEMEDLKYKYQELSRQNDYYRSIAEEANKVKEHSIILSEQIETLEDELKRKMEMNNLNGLKLVQLSDENVGLRKHIEDVSLDFEDEKNQLRYKVSELECCASCQETEISSLSMQVETLKNSQKMSESRTLADTMELNSIKRQLSNLKDLLAISQKENEELHTKLAACENVLQAVQSEFQNIQGESEALAKRNHYLEVENDEFTKELDEKDREILYLTVKVNSLTQSSYTDSQEEPPSVSDNQLYYKGTFRAQSETADSEGSNTTDRKLKEELICLTEKHSHSLIEKASECSTGQKDEDRESYVGNQNGIEKGSEESIKQPHKTDKKLLDELHNITTAYDILSNEKIRLENELLQYVENIPNPPDFESEIIKLKNSYIRLKSENDDLKYELSKPKQREDDLIDHNQRLQNLLDGNTNINHENLFVKQLEQEINQLRESNDLMKRENEKLLNDLEQVRESNGIYENDFLSTKESICELNEENNILKGEIEDLKYSMDSIKSERESLLNDHESYVRRNTVEFETLESHLSGIKESCTALEQENENLKSELEQLKNDNNELIQERVALIRLCEEYNSKSENKEKYFENKLESLNIAYNKLEADHNNLQTKLATSNNDNKSMKIEMQELENEISNLSEQKEDLFNKLNLMNKEKALPEVTSGLMDCLQEIEQLKMDILKNQNIIDSLASQLDSSEKEAAELNIELIQQINKSKVMENQIMSLEEEIIKLHGYLDSAIVLGEEIKENSVKAVKKSLTEVQAHHSRATHDIKAELIALQMSHLTAEETSLYSSTKTPPDSSRISSKLFSYKRGRKGLEKHVERLESATKNALKAVAKDDESPRQTVNKSLDMITNAMEHQDLNYQNLEHLYLEAKLSTQAIAIKYEELREELENVRNHRVKEKLELEKQFDDERQNLLMQINLEKNDTQVLKNELMEKNVENDNIKINTDASVQELESELEIFKDLYNNTLHTINDLNKKNIALTNDNNRIQNILDVSNEEMKTKLKDIKNLENELKVLMVHSDNDMTTQTDVENTSLLAKVAINQSSLSSVSLQSINLPYESKNNENIHSTENFSENNISVSSLLEEINRIPEPTNENIREIDETTTLKTLKLQQYINLVQSMQSRSSDKQGIIYSVKELSILQKALQESNHTDSSINKLNIDILSLKVSSQSDSLHDSLKVHLIKPTAISSSLNESYNLRALEEETHTQAEVNLLHAGTQADEFLDTKLLDDIEEYKIKIQTLTSIVATGERDFNIKLAAIKRQFDNNMRNIINEHNEGIERMQILHEETVRDLIRQHEGEIETLRAISAESVKVTEGLTWKNKELRRKLSELMEEKNKENAVVSVAFSQSKVCDNLTVTMIELFDIKPKKRHAPPVCAVDSSEIAKSYYEKGDTDDGKLAAQTFFKSITKKVFDGGIEVLDLQELSHLHQKVCHLWRSKQPKDEGTQKKMGSLEYDILKKKQNTIQRIMELEAAVHEERKRLHEVRDTMYSDMISTEKLSPALVCHCHDALEMSNHMQDIPSTVSQKKTRVHGPRLVCKCTPQTSKQIQPHQYENEPPTRLKDVTPRKDM